MVVSMLPMAVFADTNPCDLVHKNLKPGQTCKICNEYTVPAEDSDTDTDDTSKEECKAILAHKWLKPDQKCAFCDFVGQPASDDDTSDDVDPEVQEHKCFAETKAVANKDGLSHSIVCAVCEDFWKNEAHNWADGVCTECGAESPFGTAPKCEHPEGFTKQYIVEPTCTEAGYIKDCKFCRVCGEQYDVKEYPLGEATGHSWVTHEIQPTCTRDGLRYSACETCGVKNPLMSTIPAAGHLWEEGVCTACGTKNPFSTAPEKPEKPEEGKCTFGQHDQLMELGTKCPICGEWGKKDDDSADNAPDTKCEHPSGVSVGQKIFEATCEEDGYILTTKVCNECGEKYEIESPLGEAIGHNWKQTITEATCSADRKFSYVCRNCGESYETVDKGTATGHNYVNGKCTCGAVEPVKECTHPEKSRSVHKQDATCTENGYRTVVCGECKTVISTQTLPATGHNYVGSICTECGKMDLSVPSNASHGVTSDFQDVFFTQED